MVLNFCWFKNLSIGNKHLTSDKFYLPYMLAYKSQNLRQNLDLKVGWATYTQVIK